MKKQTRALSNSPASVLVYTLAMLAVILFLTQHLMKNVLVNNGFIRTIKSREQAQMLALGGIQLAMAQLAYPNTLDEKKRDNKGLDAGKDKEDKDGSMARYLSRVLKHLGRWQDFDLTQKVDGIEGSVRICITCEQGKIPINNAFDFKKMAFKKEYEMMLKVLEMPGRIPAGELYNRLTEYLKKRKRGIDDVSELLQVPGLEILDVFYRPPIGPAKGQKSESNKELALQDVFTTWSSNEGIDLLWLSDGLCAIIGVRRPHANDAVTRKDQFKQFQELFKKDAGSNWDENWKIIEPLYEQKPKIIPAIKGIFIKEFGARVFSVLSCGKVDNVEQYVLVVMKEEQQAEQKKPSDGSPAATPASDVKLADKKPSKSETKKAFKILRAYWL